MEKKQLILFLFEPKHWGPPSLVGPNLMWTLRTFVVEWFLSCVGWCPDSVEWFQPWNLQLNNLSLTRKWMDMAMSWWAPYSASLFAYSLIDLTFVEVSGRISSVFIMLSKSEYSTFYNQSIPSFHDTSGASWHLQVFCQRIWSMRYCWWFRNPKQPPGM